MNEIVISVTEASRNFADCINRVHYQKHTILLLKNGVAFARLVPADKAECRGRELAEALAAISLTDAEARDWQRDLKTARTKLKCPRDRWK